MSGWIYIWRNIRHRSFLSALTVFAVMITVALFVLLLMSKDGVEQGAQKGYGPFELVIGADGSESQLVLNTFYRVGAPTGNIPLDVLDNIQKSEHAEHAFGLTTGDNHSGYPIVGIDPAYFPTRYEDRRLAEGKLYASLGEVTLGYAVARALDLHIGDQFSGAHGLVQHAELDHAADNHANEDDHEDEEHAEEAHAGNEHLDEEHEAEGHASDAHDEDAHASFVYKVVGILPQLNTADDRAIFTTMEYAWAVHADEEDHKEITAIIVKPGSLLGAQGLKQEYDALDNVQAVYSSKAVADVLNMVDTGSQLLMIVMLICVLLAAVALMLALTASIQERKRDVGLLRLIGKSKSYILCSLIGEGMVLTCIGLLLGLALGHTAGALARDAVFTQTGIQLQAFVLATNEWVLIAAALLIGVLASLVPALKVYRTNALSLFRY